MNKKIFTFVAVLISLSLCACEMPFTVREVDTTPVSFEVLNEGDPVVDSVSKLPEKTYEVAESTVDSSLIYDETNISLFKLYETQKEIELTKQAEAKKKQTNNKKGSSGGNAGNGSGNGSGSSSQGGENYYTEPYTPPSYTPPSVSGYAEQVVALVNAERDNAGLGNVSATSSLNQAAQKRAEEIVSSFAHSRPDGRDCFTVFGEYGVTYMAAGENIAAGQGSPSAVMYSWMNSPGHRANILNASFTKIGVGYVSSGNYWTQMIIG